MLLYITQSSLISMRWQGGASCQSPLTVSIMCCVTAFAEYFSSEGTAARLASCKESRVFLSQQPQQGYIGTELRLTAWVLILAKSTSNRGINYIIWLQCPLLKSGFSRGRTKVIFLGFVHPWNRVESEPWNTGTICLRLCCRLELICRVSRDLSCLEWNVTLVHLNPSVLIRKLCSTLARWQATFLHRKTSLAPFVL